MTLLTKEWIDATYNADKGGCFALVSDPAHWAESGVHTQQELADYLDRAAYSDLHKDRYGYRSRGDISIEEVRAWLASVPPLVEEDDDEQMEVELALFDEAREDLVAFMQRRNNEILGAR